MTYNYTFALFPTFKATAQTQKAPGLPLAKTLAKARAKAPAKLQVQQQEPQQQEQHQPQLQQRQPLQPQQPAYAKAVRGYVPSSLADRFSMNRLIHYKSPGGCRSCS